MRSAILVLFATWMTVASGIEPQPAPPANPQTAREWRQAAMARYRQKDYDGALQAYRKSLELEPDSPASMYGIGTIFATKNEKAQALDSLRRAKTHHWDMRGPKATHDFDAIKGDPQFAALLPTPDDFTDPFVEPVAILREWDGEAMSDQFGWIARNIGDVDGDGVPDIVTSAPTSGAAGNQAGRVYVYSTRSGRLLWSADGKAEDQLGTGVEAAGDTNGDGIPDVIASAPGGGYAKVYSGRDGKVLLTLKAENKDDQFGRHASGTGDVNHDGFADLIVGAPSNNAAGDKAGSAYIFSGKDGSLLLTLHGERAGDAFGSTVAGFADRDHVLFMVGAPNAGPNQTGRAYVYGSLSTRPKFTIESDETGAALGM